MDISYYDRGTDYLLQKGVTIREERSKYDPDFGVKFYARGQDIADWFPCLFDGFGNIADLDGIVVFPFGSGSVPLKRGEKIASAWGC